MYVHAWAEIAVGGWECLNVDNHFNDNIPDSTPLRIICLCTKRAQPFSRPFPRPYFALLRYKALIFEHVHIMERRRLRVLLDWEPSTACIARFPYLPLFTDGFPSFAYSLSDVIASNNFCLPLPVQLNGVVWRGILITESFRSRINCRLKSQW